jgi:hypothetical protein
MKSIFFYSLLFVVQIHSFAQCPVNDTTITEQSVLEIRRDIDCMYTEMDTLNNRIFYPLIKTFDRIQDTVNLPATNLSLKAFIDSTINYLDSVKKIIDSQYFDLYIVKDSIRYKRACFYYATHKEIEDFITSIDLLEKSMKHLVIRGLISTIAKVQFLNSYYYMSTCRSLLLARMNNMENEMVLLKPYEPYPRGKKVLFFNTRSNAEKATNRDQNKIPTATDEIIKETRQGPRNWFVKSMAGSAAGAIIAYAIISIFRGHK